MTYQDLLGRRTVIVDSVLPGGKQILATLSQKLTSRTETDFERTKLRK